MIPAISSSGLIPNPILQQPCIPASRDKWDRLFQPMFNDYFNPLTIAVSLVPVDAAPRAVDLADSPEKVKNRIVELYFVQTEYQLADIFTKHFSRERFNFLIEKLDVLEVYLHQFWDSIYNYENSYSPEIRETKAYKTCLGYAIGVTPTKKAQKFKKPTSPKLFIVPTSPEEPTRKSKRVKRHAKKSSNASTTGFIIRETPMKSLSKKKENMVVEKRVPDMTEEESTKSEAESWENDEDDNNNKHDSRSKGSDQERDNGDDNTQSDRVPDMTEEESTKSEAESWENDEDDNNNKHDSRSKGSDQERDNGDDNTQSDSKKGSDSEHETDENESSFESDQEENKEEIKDEEEEEDEFVKTPSNDTDDKDETKMKAMKMKE
nr:hypothetical protein [Tanacetum cinerariifolium]